MAWKVDNQENLEQLCWINPLPASIRILWPRNLTIGPRHVPFICHDGLKSLRVYGKDLFSNSSQRHLSGSTSSVKNMFGDWLLNSKSVEDLKIRDSEITKLFHHSLYRKPLLDSLRTLILWYPLMNNKKMLLFGRAVKFSRSLVTMKLLEMDLAAQSTPTTTTLASILYLLHVSPNLRTVHLSGTQYELFSALRLALLHKILNENEGKWPQNAMFNLGKRFGVRQILAQLARQRNSQPLSFRTTDFNLLTTRPSEYISSKGICSSLKSDCLFTTFILS